MFASVEYAHVVSLGVTGSAFKSISVEEQEVKKKKTIKTYLYVSLLVLKNKILGRNQTFRYKLILNCFDGTAYSC